jgi:HlyD family secretion protein
MQKRNNLLLIIVLILAVAAVGYYAYSSYVTNNSNELKASGTIEAVQVNVSPETAGKIKDVLVDEGQTVKMGDPVLRLDDTLLTAQRSVASAQADAAQAALTTAQQNYDQILQNAVIAEKNTTANNWKFSAPDQFNQPLWYFSQGEQLDSAQAGIQTAQQLLTDAQANLDKVIGDLNNADFLKAEKRLADARVAFQAADDVKKQADSAAQNSGLQKAAVDAWNDARDELDTAQGNYDALLSTKSAQDVLDARGKLAAAQQRYDAAVARLAPLQTGAQSPAVVAASNVLDQAKTALASAQANLALLDAQFKKLTVYAPMDGVILNRNVEPGEFVQPGAAAFSMANLGDLTITVYVAEDHYGLIHLGQEANVTVDSFPGQTFTATVTYISDQAEFTPRNVQTVQGRSSTVYAVKLKVSDPAGKLKLGMPADVVFIVK